MPQTGSADHLLYDKLLTNVIFEKGMGASGIAPSLAPRVRSTNITGSFMKRHRRKKEAGVEVRRAPGAEVQTSERPDKELDNFRTIDNAVKELIPQEITANMEETELMAERRSTALDVLGKILHQWEKDVYGKVWAENVAGFESLYPSANVSSPSSKWDSGDENMKLDILGMKTQIYKSCGYMPNKMVLPNEVFNVITTADNELRDSIKYSQGGIVTLEILARYFEMDEVLVPMYLDDNLNGDNEDEMEIMWQGDHIGLFYVDDTPSRRKDTLMSTFYWDNARNPFLATFAGYNKGRKSEEVEVGGYFTVEEIDMACGGVLPEVLS